MAIMMAFNEQVQEDVRRMEEFDNIMRNVKPLMTIGSVKRIMKKPTPFSLILTDCILRRKAQKWEIKAHRP